MNRKFTHFKDRFLRDRRFPNRSPIYKLLACLLVIALCSFIPLRSAAQAISLSVKDAPLETVFKSITKQSGVVFFYNYRLLEKSKTVSVELNKVSLKEALNACFQNQPFSYSISGKQVTLIEKVNPKANNAPPMILKITGTVVDTTGAFLPGVTVSARGAGSATVTDQAGHFIISVPVGGTLVFSSVRFNTKEFFIDGKSNNIKIVLVFKTIQLGTVDVVYTGYQTLRQSSVAGSVSSIKGSELYFDGTNTLEQALQGKLPGVVVTNQSGQVGTRQKVRVRGTSTLLGSQEPIWVVDGVIQEDPLPFKSTVLGAVGSTTGGAASKDNFDYIRDYVGSSIGWLNPNDIDEITVLKDASATAIYGVRAANGVIVITTKKGQIGPPVITYGITVNTSERVSYDKLNLMNSQERIGVSEEIFNRGLVGTSTVNNSIGYAGALNDYLFGRTTYTQYNAQVKYLETLNMDWFKLLFRTPLSVNQNVSVSGGNANTRYYGSFSYNSTNGTAIGNELSGFTGSFGISSQVSSKLNISAKLSAASKTTDGFYLTDPYSYASKASRLIPAYDPSGNLFFYANSVGRQYNVINELNNSGSSNKQQTFNTNVSANYQIIKGLNFQSLYSINNISTTGNTYATERSTYIATIRNYDYGTAKPTDALYLNSRLPLGGEYNEDDNQNLSWNWRNSLSYTKTISNKHVFTVLAGSDLNSSHYTGFSSTTYGYLRDRGLSFATVPSLIGSTSTKFANTLLDAQTHLKTDGITNNVGIYSTLNYAYDNRYVLNFSIRNDRSNRFGQYTEEKFNPVLAGGVRWNIANEKWFEKTDWLSGLSMRASLGYQRNVVSNVSPDLILKVPTTPSTAVTDQFTGDYLLTISSLPYADLRFEKTTSLNLGFDMALFQNKVQATVEYYQKTARDLVTYLTVPAEYGVASMPVNGGSLTNRGYEISANFTPVRSRDFTWSVSINTAKNFSDLVKSGFQVNSTWRTATSGLYNKEEYPVSGLWAFDFTGINPANGYPTINLQVAANGTPTTDPTSYMKYVGKADPDFTGGIGMNFRYKKLTLGSTFNLQVGGKKFLAPAYSLTNGVPSEFDNLSRSILNRWTPTNTTATIPGLPDASVGNTILLPDGKTYTNAYEMYNYSTARVVSASELRCNNINLSYSLPEKIVTVLHCKNIRAGAGVSQPFAIVSKDFNGVDPEVATGGQPRVRSYSLSLNASF